MFKGHYPASFALILVSCVLWNLSAPAAAQDQGSALTPAVVGLTVAVENISPGFLLRSNDESLNSLYLNFFVSISNLVECYGQIKSLRIENYPGNGWNLPLPTSDDAAKGFSGGWMRYHIQDLSLAPNSIVPMKYTVIMTLADGKVEKNDFAIPGPRTKSKADQGLATGARADLASVVPLFLVNDAYQGPRTMYHVEVPEPARILGLSMDEASVYVSFSVQGPPVDNCWLSFYDASGVYVGETPSSYSAGGSAQWLNGGLGLKFSGERNEVSFDLSKVKWAKGKSKRDIAGASVTTTDVQPAGSNVLGWTSLYSTHTGIYACTSTGVSGSPELLLAAALKAQAAIKAKAENIAPLPWSGTPEGRKAWEIRLSGILAQYNRYGFAELRPFEDSPAFRVREANSIKSGWNVIDRQSLLANIQWLYDVGHSADYERCAALIDAHPDLSAGEAAAAAGDRSITPQRIEFARSVKDAIGKQSLCAWDMARLVYLARDGYALGFLSEKETWAWIDKAAGRVLGRYRSWVDFGNGYLLGRLFWTSGDPDDARSLSFREASVSMQALFAPGGAWADLSWPCRESANSDFDQDLR